MTVIQAQQGVFKFKSWGSPSDPTTIPAITSMHNVPCCFRIILVLRTSHIQTEVMLAITDISAQS